MRHENSVTLDVQRILVMSACLLICSVLTAQKIQFHCHGWTLTEDEKAKIQAVAEYESAFFAEVFGKRQEPTIRMHFYGDEKEFIRKQRRSVTRIISETGIYNPISNKILVVKWSRFMATSYHELSHAVYHHYSHVRPDWIDEGLAEYFKSATFDSLGNITLHENSFRRKNMKKYVADSSFTIRKTISARAGKFHNNKDSINYNSVSWGIVYFLRTQHDDIFRRILFDISRIYMRSANAIDKHYPGGVRRLEMDLVEFYK